jgi:stage IV sporulation protein FB
MKSLFRVAEIRRVPVFVHWGVFALVLVVLVTSGRRLLSAVVAVVAYLAMLLIHEYGHQWVATRRGYRVLAVELFPLHGRCRFESPRTNLDRSLIAWGGVAAQFLVAIPFAAFVLLRGYTQDQSMNAALAILGFVSPAVATFNLIPAGNLDGQAAWRLFGQLMWRSSPRASNRKRPGALRALK